MKNLGGVAIEKNAGIAIDVLSSGYLVVTAHAWDGEARWADLSSKRLVRRG